MPARRPATARVRVDLRLAILDAAAKLLAQGGPEALSVRRVAEQVGASTMVVYTHFHDKQGLVDAVLEHAFAGFAGALAAVEVADPWQHLRALGHAYRSFATARPDAYRLLFERCEPSVAVPGSAARAFEALTVAIAKVMAALDRPARDIEPFALDVWAATHGIVQLELAGVIPAERADATFEHMLDFIVAGLRG